MKQGYTQREAEALVGRTFETHAFLTGVPRRTRGLVIQAIDAGDHWNIYIEWQLAGRPSRNWYDKYDVQQAMVYVEPEESK